MDRRTLLTLMASLPAVAATPAGACIIAPFNAAYVEQQNARVRRLFEAWWDRDLDRFRAFFTNPVRDDGTPLDRAIVEAWRRDGVFRLSTSTRAQFDRFFANRTTSKRIDRIINTQLGVIVACQESTNAQAIMACSDAGQSHLFFVVMSGLNPEAVMHLNSGSGGEEPRFVVWSDRTSG